jgi:hypothetical protein
MPKILEHDIQRAVCLWLDGQPAHGRPGALVPGVVYWHTPLGGTRRDAFEGARLKQIGVKAGIHDLLFLAPGHQFRIPFGDAPYGVLFGLELKAADGKIEPAQRAMHALLLAAGMAGSAVAWSLAEAKAQLIAWRLAVSR